MNTDNKMITEYVLIKDYPETKSVATKTAGEAYKFDILRGTRIPSNPNARKEYIKEMEFKFSPNSNIPGIKKSAIDVTKMIAQNFENLKSGKVYAKVSLFMSTRENKAGFVDTYVPFINDVEFIETVPETQPFIDAVLRTTTEPTF